MTELHEIGAQDFDVLKKFFRENDVTEITQTFTAFPLNEQTAEIIACHDHLDKYFLLFEQSNPVGFSMLRGYDEGYSVPSFGVFIDHRQLGKGLGKMLLKLTVDEAVRTGSDKVRLSVYKSNSGAVKIYSDFGFQVIDEEPIELHGRPDKKLIMVYTAKPN